MSQLNTRDVEYSYNGTQMCGLLVASNGVRNAPAVVLLHDAFGLGDDTIAIAEKLARLGYTVFAADIWGNRFTPDAESEIGPLISSMLTDRTEWASRVSAAHHAASAQPEVDGDAIVSLGYCFGGSSALEYVRQGGNVAGVIAVHPGLDLLEWDWSAAEHRTSVLIATGSEDPMASAEDLGRLQSELSTAGMHWQVQLYSHTKHAFTNPKSANSPMPHVVDYNPLSAARAWQATEQFLNETLARSAQPVS